MKSSTTHRRNRMTPEARKAQFSSKLLLGFFVITAGILILLSQMGMSLPKHLISGSTIMIAAGLVVLVKHQFKTFWGYALILLGSIFLMKRFYPEQINTDYIWPVLIMLFGISIIYKAVYRSKKKINSPFEFGDSDSVDTTTDSYFKSNAIFGGVNKQIVTKNFQFAEINSVFGGQEITMSNADMKQSAKMEINAVFGGVTIILPVNWEIKSDMNSLFGSIEDTRPPRDGHEVSKTLYLEGNCIFGGIEIRSY